MKVARLMSSVLLALGFAATAGTIPAGGDGAVFPFVKGTTWTYAGTVKWRSAYVLGYRTLPDEETLTLVPGIGITSFAYVHHGTIVEANVHLVAYRRGEVK
jgi:hypothetical protein